jgi:nucleoside-diphosphate-sugar epimerase
MPCDIVNSPGIRLKRKGISELAGTSDKIIEELASAVPFHQESISAQQVSRLRELTAELAAAKPEAIQEYSRFTGIANRGLSLPESRLTGRLGGSCVLVTGGTGCVGSALMAQLVRHYPGRLVSISRGVTQGWPRQGIAEYQLCDIRDRDALSQVIADVRPDVIFHTAAQMSPALAETQVHRTVTTNTLGAQNVLEAAAAAGIPQVVMASTGKALRPYSPEVYTASKRAAECIAAGMAPDASMMISAARFTHVVDNSLMLVKFLGWALTGDVIRLHSPSIGFYAQSALESAQLLLAAYLGAVPGEFRVHAITDLGWPVSLLDVALGVIDATGSKSPVYISGYDPGYEEVPFPGLYDPATAGDVSPLLNAFETAALAEPPCPGVDAFTLRTLKTAHSTRDLAALEETWPHGDHDSIVMALNRLSWSFLNETLGAADPAALDRCAKIASQHENVMTPVHQRITKMIRTHALYHALLVS